MSPARYAYFDSPRNSAEDQDGLLEKSQESTHPQYAGLRERSIPVWLVIILCISLSVFSGLLSATAVSQSWRRSLDRVCLSTHYQHSPLTKDVEISYKKIQFNGVFLKENVYRQPAGPEVDAAWENLGVDNRSFAVPVENAADFGLTKNHVQIKEKYGGGYPANVEALHQLHCLNLLRKSLYYNYDYYKKKGEGAFSNEDVIVQKHVSHCVDILRQQLMCTADIGVMGQVWYTPNESDDPQAFVDFNTRHMCRNFDDIREWAKNHQLPVDVPKDFLEPPKPGTKISAGVP